MRRLGGHGGTARSSPAPTTARGGHPPASTARSTRRTAQYGYAPGPACTPKTHNHPAKGSYRPKAVVRGTLVLVEVERLPRQTRIPKHLWLWWRGPGQPDLTVLWRAYVHRFDLKHTYRFCKQTLNWTTHGTSDGSVLFNFEFIEAAIAPSRNPHLLMLMLVAEGCCAQVGRSALRTRDTLQAFMAQSIATGKLDTPLNPLSVSRFGSPASRNRGNRSTNKRSAMRA